MPAEGFAQLTGLLERVGDVATGAALTRIQHKVGAEGKRQVTRAAVATLGADRAMHNFRGGKRRLGVGYDVHAGGEVVLKLRPVGLWKLADAGRKKSGVIRPRKRRGARAVVVNGSPRATSRYGPSRGLHALDKANANVQSTVGRTADRAVADEIGRVLGAGS